MSTSEETLANLLLEYPGADIILRSDDFHHFRVPKSYIVHCSPVLDQLIQKALDPPHDAHNVPLPVIQLPESGAILHSLLTFIFPVIPIVPSTTEKSMELLSVAQKYQMVSVMAYMRYNMARHTPPSTERDTALSHYHLAQKYGLRHEALQAARTISKYPMSLEDLEDKFNMMPGVSLYELWKYRENVRAILKCDLTEFRTSGARGTLTGLRCGKSTSSQSPLWLDDYIESIGDAPNRFNLIEFNTALVRHIRGEPQTQPSGRVGCPDCGEWCECGRLFDVPQYKNCTCGSMSSETIRNFWGALASVVDSSFEKVNMLMIISCLGS